MKVQPIDIPFMSYLVSSNTDIELRIYIAASLDPISPLLAGAGLVCPAALLLPPLRLISTTFFTIQPGLLSEVQVIRIILVASPIGCPLDSKSRDLVLIFL
jgi:hypothetical protein